MDEYIERGSAMRTAHILRPEDKELMSAISIIPAVSVPQWISVKDRLPEDNDRVIAFRPYEVEGSVYRYCVMWGWSLKTSISYRGITHWMQPPEPPKGENDG